MSSAVTLSAWMAPDPLLRSTEPSAVTAPNSIPPESVAIRISSCSRVSALTAAELV